MKITKSRLKQIIKEELKGRENLNESSMDNLRFYDVDYGRASDDYQDCEDRFSGKYAYLYDMCCNEEDPDFDPDSSECEDPEPDYDDSPAWLGEVDQQEQYGVVDHETGDVVYITSYKNRNRARGHAERKNQEHGSHRYSATPLNIRVMSAAQKSNGDDMGDLKEAKSARQAIEDIRKVLSRWPEDHEHTKELRAALSGIKF